MTKFPPGSIRAMVAEHGDLWMSQGVAAPTKAIRDEVADEMAINYAMRCTSWPNTTFEQRARFRRSSMIDRAFMGFPMCEGYRWR